MKVFDPHRTIRIEARFNGPPGSANGGYACGLIAGAIGDNINVRLHRPPPLGVSLQVEACSANEWQIKQGEQTIAVATRTQAQTRVPKPPSYLDSLMLSKNYEGFKAHPYPTCFVCGPRREVGDGLRIFPGAMPGAQQVAAPWLPHADLSDGEGKVRPEFIWAALDCPGYFASFAEGRVGLLGELAVHIDRSVHIEEPCVIVAWRILVEGRKHKVGTALFDEEGERCALGLATWVESKTSE
jgi:hypothetical protein